MTVLSGRSTGVTWGIAAAAMAGQAQSGDRQIVHPVIGGTLLAVADGLGHGEEAAEAAARCAGVLMLGDTGRVIALMRACHEALIGTRGVALSVAVLDVYARSLTWLSVGNVRGLVVRADPHTVPAREELVSRGGIVGLSLPPLQATTLSVEAGDLFVMATDGVDARFPASVDVDDDPVVLAQRILRLHGDSGDDALVLVARLLGPPAEVPPPLTAA